VSEQLDVLKLVVQRLQRADIAYMISGSIALNYYAQPRLTRDIDIVIALRLEDAERVTNLFAEDFYVDADAVRNAIIQLGTFNIIHYDHVVKVDCIVRKDTPYRQEEFARRIAVEIEGVTMWLVTAEDLLLSKLVWATESHSEMQLQDVRSLLRSVADLDWMYIERWANTLTVGELLREVRG
jgi:nucleotidyltransferase AbiEii toxin of type IV toxin-antitoxin system